MPNTKELRKLGTGLAYLLPNILGFMAFVLFPLVFSFFMAFTNWDLTLHNMFKDEPVRWTGLDNFIRLVNDPNFWRFFGNTLFFMIGIPFSIAGSLIFALLLSKNIKGTSWAVRRTLIMSAILISSCLFLVVLGMGGTAIALLLTGVFGLIMIGGVAMGSTLYRTLFYTPHFTAGIATYILWKKLYAPHTGPVNQTLTPMLDATTEVVRTLPPMLGNLGFWLLIAASAALLYWSQRRLARVWLDGDIGQGALWSSYAFLATPWICGFFWLPGTIAPWLCLGFIIAGAATIITRMKRGTPLEHAPSGKAFGTNIMLACGVMVLTYTLIGLSLVLYNLPAMAATPDGLTAPEWLTNYHWAKPALMIMALWAGLGSNQMILYLAGLTNVPEELYEAADIDGASSFAKFWNVTWPQLAPITFFIVVMAVIHGLQGGFEMARTMTQGGPAGATTTLSYFVYTEGFETGRLGFASAVAWTLFLLVFVVTIFNTKFGGRYVND